ncbi:hypothetical protein SVAN01_03274 [Stagonosporopsis vannaccii]|nr:hypothetical protein SVAN01_03274 [Stagonosporopsis vannaccii]
MRHNFSDQHEIPSHEMLNRDSVIAQPPSHIMLHSSPSTEANVFANAGTQTPLFFLSQHHPTVQVSCPSFLNLSQSTQQASNVARDSALHEETTRDSAAHAVVQMSNITPTLSSAAPSSGRTSTPCLHGETVGFQEMTDKHGQPKWEPVFIGQSADIWETLSVDACVPLQGQAVQTQSRLPPNSVARKAPRKGTFMSTPTVLGTPKVKKTRSENAKGSRQHIIPFDTSAPATAAQRTMKKGNPELEKQEADQSLTAMTSDLILQIDDKISTPSATTPSDVSSETQQEPQASVKYQPRFQYWLAPEMEGVKTALGLDNWTEYLILTEKRMRGEIMDKEFEVQERRLFQVSNVDIRRKIRDLVLQQTAGWT